MTWRTACSSESACVEVKFVTACDTNGCVEVLNDGDRVLVRVSGNREVVVEATREEWLTFLDGAKRGVFDLD